MAQSQKNPVKQTKQVTGITITIGVAASLPRTHPHEEAMKNERTLTSSFLYRGLASESIWGNLTSALYNLHGLYFLQPGPEVHLPTELGQIMTQLQDSVYVYAAPFLLLPGLLLLCTSCTYRKSNASCAKQKLTDHTEQVSQAATGSTVDGKCTVAVEAGHQPERKDAPNTHTEEEPARTAPLANRRLPSLPKSATGRMAGSLVYDTVVDMHEWPASEAKVGRRQTSSCSSLYAEVRRGEKKSEEASICRDLASPSGDKDFPLYAKVNKTGKRMIKSELIS